MKVINIHSREYPVSSKEVGILLDSLSSKNDLLWPHHLWPRMKFDKQLSVNSAGGHGQSDIMLKSMSLKNSFSSALWGQRVLMDIMVMNSLKLHPDKTRLIEFGRPWSNEQGRKRGTFDFLGFTFHWGKTLKGYWAIKKKTARKRLSRFMKQLWRWCKANRHEPIGDQHLMLISKLRGFYQYFGVRDNYKALEVVFEYAEKAWRRWSIRRNSNGVVMFEDLRGRYPKPRIVHNI
jgi:hypothetical protein